MLANNNDVDILLIKHTDAIKKTMTEAKMDFDNYNIKNLEISNKDTDKNKSLTARESQIKLLFDDETGKGEINSIVSFKSDNFIQPQIKESELKEKRIEKESFKKHCIIYQRS